MCEASFILFFVSFAVQTLLNLSRSYLFIFVFISIILGDRSKKILLQFMSENALPIFSFRLQGGRMGRREFGMDRYTLLYIKWLTNKSPLYNKGNSV